MANRQQLLFIQSLFTEKAIPNNGETIKVNVKECHQGLPMTIEVSANTEGKFVLYRVHTTTGAGLWSSWDDQDEVEKWFKSASLLSEKKKTNV